VILTRQTCGQRSSGAAESKRRAIGNYFSERICYMFPISKCRGDRDLGLVTSSLLAFGEPQRNSKIRFFLRQNTFFSQILVTFATGFAEKKMEFPSQVVSKTYFYSIFGQIRTVFEPVHKPCVGRAG